MTLIKNLFATNMFTTNAEDKRRIKQNKRKNRHEKKTTRGYANGDPEDAQPSFFKKRKTEKPAEQLMDKKKNPAFSDNNKRKKKSQSYSSATTATKEDDDLDFFSDTDEMELTERELQRLEHRRRREARMVHSDGPMILSARTNFRISQKSAGLNYSPIRACKLSFAGSSEVKTSKTRRQRKNTYNTRTDAI